MLSGRAPVLGMAVLEAYGAATQVRLTTTRNRDTQRGRLLGRTLAVPSRPCQSPRHARYRTDQPGRMTREGRERDQLARGRRSADPGRLVRPLLLEARAAPARSW